MNGLPKAGGLGILVILTLVLYFRGLGTLPFYTVGEPREALEIWEEIHTGEWILPMRNGEDLPSKPPLFHWLGGVTAAVTGSVDELSARLPSALLATVTVLLVYWFGATQWSVAAGLYAACMLAANFEWIRAARSARVDMVLTAFLTGACIAFQRASATLPPSRLALVLFYLCIGLAMLAKGPIGVLLPVMVGGVYLAVRRDLLRLRHLHVVLGGLLALAPPAVWYLLAARRGGGAFVHKQLLVENLMTFFGWTADPGTPQHSFFYVVPAFFGGFAPWSVFALPLGITLLQRRGRLDREGWLYPLVWFLAIFLFFAIAAGKRTVYLLPLYPAAALLCGLWWSRLSSGEPVLSPRLERGLQWVGIVALLAIAGTSFAVIAEAFGGQPLDRLRPFLHHTDQDNLPLVHEICRNHRAAFSAWATLLAATAAVFAGGVWRRRWPLVFAALLVFVASTTFVVNEIIHPEIAQRRTLKPFLTQVRNAVRDDQELAFYDTFDYGAVFYWRDRIPVVHGQLAEVSAGGGARYLLMWRSQWRQLAQDEQQRLDIVRESEGSGPDGKDRLLLVAFRPGTS